jgi:drug/metabolite transporter (DMT)-like permease
MENLPRRFRLRGILMVGSSAVLWGISGTVAQVLFQRKGFQVEWLVSVRLLLSGFVLLTFALWRKQAATIWSVWKEPRDRFRILWFGIAGLLGVQYTYFAAIKMGNATTATLLQFLGPAFLTLLLALRWRRWPTRKQLCALGLTMLGTFLLVTNGSLEKLYVPIGAVCWGLASALALVFYTLYPAGLLQRWGSIITIGWGMMIGGIALSLFYPPWIIVGQRWSTDTVFFVLFVIVWGTLVAFYLYLESLRFIAPAEAGMVVSIEPLAAAVTSVWWLHQPLRLLEILGGICITATVIILSLHREAAPQSSTSKIRIPRTE